MKKLLLFLAFFGLLVRMASGQVLEVNSPTKNNLYCAFSSSASSESEDITLYVFGANGLGYVSKDKCASWQELVVDPSQQRSIRSSIMVNDTLLLVAGDNNLLKYSNNKGVTFKDLSLPDTSPVIGLACSGDSVLFNHEKSLTCWYLKTNTFKSSTDHLKASENQTCLFLSSYLATKVVTRSVLIISSTTKVLHFRVKTAYPWAWGQLNPSYDSICSLDATDRYTLISLQGKKVGQYVYEGYLTPETPDSRSKFAYRYFPELTQSQTIKSSFVTRAHNNFWHVGGDNTGKNGFIIKDGVIIKKTPEFILNFVTSACYVDPKGNSNKSDEVIMVGNNGKIFSNRLDLKEAAVINAPKDDYLVSDPSVNFGEDATVTVSGSEVGVTYKVFEEGSGNLIFSFLGTGQAWNFLASTKISRNYNISASRDNSEVFLKDIAKVEIIMRTDYVVSDPKVVSGGTATINVSGSQKGLSYYIYDPVGNLVADMITGTGEPINFLVKVTENTTFLIRVNYGNQINDFPDHAVVTVWPLSVRTIDLSKLAVFPNPCDDQITISSYENISATISNISGQVIKIFQLEQGVNSLSVTDLKSGIYFLTTQKNVFKLIKQ
jgi:hypothetical protein